MTTHDPEVAAVLANWTQFGLCPKWCEDQRPGAHGHNFLDALTAANYAVVKVPEGVAVAHGAKLLFSTWAGADPDEWVPLYAIEAAP